jgi:hypothetical protein
MMSEVRVDSNLPVEISSFNQKRGIVRFIRFPEDETHDFLFYVS